MIDSMLPALLTALATLAPQGPGGDMSLDRAPSGVVRRADTGAPIAGAEVRVEARRYGPYHTAVSEAELRLPLPAVATGTDGRFVLPILPEQRMLHDIDLGQYWLVVEKAGFAPWVERLPTGLAGYLGSDVALRALGRDEQLIVADDPAAPGAWIAVRDGVQRATLHEIPIGGELRIAVPIWPSPLTTLSAHYRALGSATVQRLRPGHSSEPAPVRHLDDKVEWTPRPLAEVTRVEVVAKDRRKLSGLRSLHVVGSSERWFDAPSEAQVVWDAAIRRPVAICADGMLAFTPRDADGGGRIELEPVPDPGAGRALLVVGEADQPVAGATVQLWGEPRGDRPARPIATLRGDAAGRVEIPARYRREPLRYVVRAPEHGKTTAIDLRGVERIRLAPVHGARVVVRVAGEDGRPLRRALVMPPTAAYDRGAVRPGVLRPDRSGICDLGVLPPGTHKIRVAAPGHVVALHDVAIDADSEARIQRLDVALQASVPLAVRTLDEDGEPVPHVPFHVMRRGASRPGLSMLGTDSLGRMILPMSFPETSVQLYQAKAFAGRWAAYSTGGEAHEIVTARPRQVAVRTGPITVRGFTLRQTNSTSSSSGSDTRAGVGVLVEMPATAGSEMTLYVDGAPVRIRGDDLDDGDALQVLDRTAVRRRVQLKVSGIPDDALTELAARPKQLHSYADTGDMLERDERGRLFLVSRDTYAYECELVHPRYIASETVKLADGEADADKSISVAMSRGATAAFRIPRPENASGTFYWNFHLRAKGDRSWMMRSNERKSWKELPDTGKGYVEVVCPRALPPGEYQYNVHANGLSKSGTFEVTGTKDESIDLRPEEEPDAKPGEKKPGEKKAGEKKPGAEKSGKHV